MFTTHSFAEILSHLRPNIASSARNKRWPIDRLIPYAKNSRTHSEAQIAQLAASMKEWGWTNPVLADEAGLGLAEVPVMVARGWSAACLPRGPGCSQIA